MKIGFIGTGEITKAVVSGILSSRLKIKKIYLSERNKKISKQLSKKSKKIKIIKNNQDIINNSNWLFLSVTPAVGNKILNNYKFKKNQIIVSFISTINLEKLKKITKKKTNIVRAIPLPPISYMKGPIPIFPPNKKVKKFFGNLGNVIEIKNEKKSLYLWTTSSLMAPFYYLLLTTSKILQRGGINKVDSENYIKSLFYGLAYSALNDNKIELKNLIKKSQTPKGLNQQALNELKKKGFYKMIDKVSVKILKRLTE